MDRSRNRTVHKVLLNSRLSGLELCVSIRCENFRRENSRRENFRYEN